MIADASRKARAEIERLRALQPTEFMIVGMFRYALGRMTYVVDLTSKWLVAHWQEIDRGTQAIIERELEKAFAIDDEDRQHGNTRLSRLGHDCDRASWQLVRNLWMSEPHDNR
jgi:hypothetical protein